MKNVFKILGTHLTPAYTKKEKNNKLMSPHIKIHSQFALRWFFVRTSDEFGYVSLEGGNHLKKTVPWITYLQDLRGLTGFVGIYINYRWFMWQRTGYSWIYLDKCLLEFGIALYLHGFAGCKKLLDTKTSNTTTLPSINP